MRRLGIMGGTFDPIHAGHLLLARYLSEHIGLDRVLFIPAADPPHKESRADDILAVEERWKMVCLALDGADEFEPSRLEMDRPGKSYTVDTLRELRRLHPGSELFLLIGADNIPDMSTWHDPHGILEHCTVVAGSRRTRSAAGDAEFDEHVSVVDTPVIEISSTEIRERLRTGLSVRWLVPDAVEAHIRQRNLYLP